MYKILVLMSTYNGEKYLRSQLKSIINQMGVKSIILVRDDQSSDKTCEILGRYENKCNIKWYRGRNIGAANSFLDLLLHAENYVDLDDIDYIALSDQDDIWDWNKLYMAATTLQKNRDASLYCCSLNTFSENEKEEHHVFIPQIYNGMESLIRNSAAGCTMVFTKKLLTKINAYQPSRIIMHDAWIMQICYALGLQVIIDAEPHIQYRLHGNNTCGAALSVNQKIVAHIRCIMGNNYARAATTAHELLTGYQYDIAEEYVEMLRIIDKSEKTAHRKLKLLTLALRQRFSNMYRKAIFIMEIVIGRV